MAALAALPLPSRSGRLLPGPRDWTRPTARSGTRLPGSAQVGSPPRILGPDAESEETRSKAFRSTKAPVQLVNMEDEVEPLLQAIRTGQKEALNQLLLQHRDTVRAAVASRFVITAPSNVTAGRAFSLTITVQDAYGNVVTGYTGTIHFKSTDSRPPCRPTTPSRR